MDVHGLDFLQLIREGALATYPLIFCSIVGLAVVLERLWKLRNVISTTAALAAATGRSLASGDIAGALEVCRRAAPCPAQRVFRKLLESHGGGRSAEELRTLSEERQFEEVQQLGASLWVLGTIGSSAPFIGLFGTVVGIIKAFHSMAELGTGGFNIVAAGISEALIATALGLAVAIVALVFYNYLQSRVERIDAALRIYSARLVEAVAAGGRAHGA
jgi:biopolymer transport protein ExbB